MKLRTIFFIFALLVSLSVNANIYDDDFGSNNTMSIKTGTVEDYLNATISKDEYVEILFTNEIPNNLNLLLQDVARLNNSEQLSEKNKIKLLKLEIAINKKIIHYNNDVSKKKKYIMIGATAAGAIIGYTVMRGKTSTWSGYLGGSNVGKMFAFGFRALATLGGAAGGAGAGYYGAKVYGGDVLEDITIIEGE